jgi:hypothetical protein
MTKLTVTIDTKHNARLFLEMLNALKFVKKVEPQVEFNETLSKEEIELLEARWNDYIKNPKDVQTWKEVKSELVKKYAR